MALLEVTNIKKIYSTRFGGKQGTGAFKCYIFCRGR